jgi:cob(I)alamin adenosyltransferase
VDKDDPRVRAYGAVDEANAVIGFAVALLPKGDEFQDLRVLARRIQRDLFDVGRELATPEDRRTEAYIQQEDVDMLERAIDRLDAELQPLTHFILPGGHAAAGALHVARTVVRRAERAVVTLQRTEPVQPMVRKYLNRLSDVLFVMARTVNARMHNDDPVVDFQAPKPSPFLEGQA